MDADEIKKLRAAARAKRGAKDGDTKSINPLALMERTGIGHDPSLAIGDLPALTEYFDLRAYRWSEGDCPTKETLEKLKAGGCIYRPSWGHAWVGPIPALAAAGLSFKNPLEEDADVEMVKAPKAKGK